MIGLGTIINTAAIVVGGLIGLLFGKFIPKRVQDAILTVNGIAVIFIGGAGCISKMLVFEDGEFDTQKAILMTLSLVIGTVIGEFINLDKWITKFGDWLKKKTHSEKEGGFTGAFVTASCTVCIGAMAVVGAINDGLFADHTILITKAVLDFVIIMVMSCTLGKGCLFSAIPVFIFQGVFTLLAKLIKPIMTDLALDDLSLVGSVLIFCVGLNLIREKKISVANMLPSIVIAVAFAFIPALN